MDQADVKRSKRLARVLRHRPGSVGLSLDPNGWVEVSSLLRALAEHGPAISREDLLRVVATNDKQRFEIDSRADRIRARQGHSVEVELALEPVDPPPVLYHGTPQRHLASILTTGLDRRRRHHVHLSADVETARRVGRRRGEEVILEVDAAAMAAAGMVFWRTGNGVWLTDAVPPSFIAVHSPRTGAGQ